jgi:sulfur carrier protein
MMKIRINGETKAIEQMNVAELVKKLGYSYDKVALEYNMVVLPKNLWTETAIKDGDIFEIVSFVGGG